jgi:hypothetical protein
VTNGAVRHFGAVNVPPVEQLTHTPFVEAILFFLHLAVLRHYRYRRMEGSTDRLDPLDLFLKETEYRATCVQKIAILMKELAFTTRNTPA